MTTLRRLRSPVTYLRDFRFKSLFVRYFLLMFMGLTLPMMALNMLYGGRMEKTVQQSITELNEAQLSQRYELMNAMLVSARKVTYLLAQQDSVRYLGFLPDDVGMDTSGNLKMVRETLSLFDHAFDYYHSLIVYLAESGTIITRQGVSSVEIEPNVGWTSLYSPDMPNKPQLVSSFGSGTYPHLLTMVYPIMTGKKAVGLVATQIDVEELAKSFGTGKYKLDQTDNNLIILDESVRSLLYSDEYDFLYHEDTDFSPLRQLTAEHPDGFSLESTVWGRNYIVSGRFEPKNRLWYFLLMPVENFRGREESNARVLQLCIIISLVICIVQSIVQAISVYQPIRKTIESIRAQTGTPEKVPRGGDELREVQGFIRRVQEERTQLTATIAQQMEELHAAQMYALQTQINPHFLYNTLESIGSAEALKSGTGNEISSAIFTLGRMLRCSLTGDSPLVSMAQEMDHVALYAKVMDFRYSGQIRVRFSIPDEVMHLQIVKLTLQPLIENAIVHGLNARHYEGNIWVSCAVEDGDLVIRVDDDGVGMSAADMDALRARVAEPVKPGMHHIGLRNVNQRLKLVFGDAYGLTIGASPRGGLRVTVRFAAVPFDAPSPESPTPAPDPAPAPPPAPDDDDIIVLADD